ncbi:ATP-binding cassette domain-containing protein [Virgibacillus xinjiangensis]|uniref:ATP-binding cassette domain-containing protein n=1 Tax=Virgibacillus xinjiangensis TaxID=393090 RepID=A0ABV7CZB5_9BACI
MSLLTISNLTKKFGNFTALDGLNMEVEKGEIYGFIGPNGAGKSTTIRVLLGMLKATSGRAQIFGKDVWKNAVDIHRKISYVPGDVKLWPNLTGGEVIDMFVRLHGGRADHRRSELMERFDFDPSKKCRTYSKGNRQKVALIAAFCVHAELYILDEPTSGLDPLMESVFQDCVQELKQEGKSILLSSHILSEVEKLCDRVGIIRQGSMIESGTLEELRHLRGTNLSVETREPATFLEQMEGVHDIKKNGHTLSLQVDQEAMEQVMKQLSSLGIISLESRPPTLEDLFMRHYHHKEKLQSGGGS